MFFFFARFDSTEFGFGVYFFASSTHELCVDNTHAHYTYVQNTKKKTPLHTHKIFTSFNFIFHWRFYQMFSISSIFRLFLGASFYFRNSKFLLFLHIIRFYIVLFYSMCSLFLTFSLYLLCFVYGI